MARNRELKMAVSLAWWQIGGGGLLVIGLGWIWYIHSAVGKMPWAKPMGLAIAAFMMVNVLAVTARSFFRQRKRETLLCRQQSLDTLRLLSWQQFEQVVGQVYVRNGYRVTETGQGGADGGVDLLLQRGAFRYLVQCKHYRSGSIGVPVVREMFGLSVHYKTSGVKIVTTGRFTKQAYEFARGKHIELVDGTKLVSMIGEINGCHVA